MILRDLLRLLILGGTGSTAQTLRPSIPPEEMLRVLDGSGRWVFRVRIKRPHDAEWTDVTDSATAGDWVVKVRMPIGTPDEPVFTFSVELILKADGVSTSFGVASSALNRDATDAFAPLAYPGNAVVLDAANLAPGETRADAVWRHWRAGEVEDGTIRGARVELTCVNLDGVVRESKLKGVQVRGAPDPGVPVEVEAQSLLDDGSLGVQLRVLGLPDFGIGEYKTEELESRGERIRALARARAWDVRYLWDDDAQEERYTLWLPPREKTEPDLTVPRELVVDVPDVKVDRQYVRNEFEIEYPDASTGKRERRTRVNEASRRQFRARPMKISEGDDSTIQTATQADALNAYADNDLSQPPTEKRARLPFIPWLDLHHLLRFVADGNRYDFDSDWSVTGGEHTVDGEQGAYTELNLRGGSPVGMYFGWFRRAAPGKAPDAWKYCLYNLTKTDLNNELVRLTWEQGPFVAEVAPWIVDVAGGTGATTDAIAAGTRLRSLTTERQLTLRKPKDGRELHGKLVPYTADGQQVGDILGFEIDAIPPRASGRVRVVARVGDTASLSVEISAAASEYPLTAYVYEDDDGDDIAAPGVPLVSIPFISDGSKDFTTIPELADRPLPLREMRRWPLRVVTVSGAEYWLTPGSADRDALPDGTRATWDDYEAQPIGRVEYDDDTDTVEVVTPTGTKTYAGLSGSGVVLYVVGASVLDTSFGEPLLAVGELREGYEVYATGGGVRSRIWAGALHGVSPIAPTVNPRVVPSADLSTATVRVVVASPVGEPVRLEWQENESAGAPISAGTYVASGTEITIPTTFSLLRDNFPRIRVRARGQQSGIDGTWVSVSLAPKGTAYLDNFNLWFDPDDGKLHARAVGGAFCAQVRIRIADEPGFSAPLLDQTVALLDGDTVDVETTALTVAQKGRTWHADGAAINAGGVMSTPVADTEPLALADPLITQHTLVNRDGGAWVRARFSATPATAFAQWSPDGSTDWTSITAYNNDTQEGDFTGTYSGEVGGDVPAFQPNAAGGEAKFVYLRGLTGASEPGAVYRVEIPPRPAEPPAVEPSLAGVVAAHGLAGNCGISPLTHTITITVNNPDPDYTLRVTVYTSSAGETNDVVSAEPVAGTVTVTHETMAYVNGFGGTATDLYFLVALARPITGAEIDTKFSNTLKRLLVSCG